MLAELDAIILEYPEELPPLLQQYQVNTTTTTTTPPHCILSQIPFVYALWWLMG